MQILFAATVDVHTAQTSNHIHVNLDFPRNRASTNPLFPINVRKRTKNQKKKENERRKRRKRRNQSIGWFVIIISAG